MICRGLTDADPYATAAYATGDRARTWLESRPGTRAFAVAAGGTSWSTGRTGGVGRSVTSPS